MGNSKFTRWFTVASATTAALAGLAFASTQKAQAANKFQETYHNTKKAVKGGTLNIAQVDDSSFKGTFLTELITDAYTQEVWSVTGGNLLFNNNKNDNYVDGGTANVKFDKDAKTATIKVRDNAKWSDGQPVTTDDLIFSYKIIANKNSTSTLYTDNLANIVGIEDYHAGKTDDISGLEKKDDKTLVVHFKEMSPAMEFLGSGYISDYAEPYHYLKDIPVEKLASNSKVTKTPLSFGPYKLSKTVQGESAQFVPNEYYWGKKASIAKISVSQVSTAQAAQAVKSHKYDLFWDLSGNPRAYSQVKNVKGYKFLGTVENYYSYMGYNVGYSTKDGLSKMDNNRPLTKYKALRQALAYSMDVNAVTKKFGYGLTFRATNLESKYFGKYSSKSTKGFPYNMKKANSLLDKAGFKKDSDGYRKLPNGKPLTLTVLASKSTDDWKSTVQYYMQQWKKLGVRTKLYNGRLQEFNSYAEDLQSTKKNRGWDVWFGAFSTGSEPSGDVVQTYSSNSGYNFGHFVTKKNTDLLATLNNAKSYDNSYRVAQFHKWEQNMNDEAYVVPLLNRYRVEPVSTRVKGYTLAKGKAQADLYGTLQLTEK